MPVVYLFIDRCRCFFPTGSSGFNAHFSLRYPGFSLRSNPGLKLANAFGVLFRLGLKKGFYVLSPSRTLWSEVHMTGDYQGNNGA